MIAAQPMLTYTVLYIYSTANPEVLGSNPVKSKNNFTSVMLT